MIRKISFNKIGIMLFIAILLTLSHLSYAYGNSFTVNVPNGQGGYTAVVIQQSGSGFVGPQGEYYTQFPTVAYLQAMYATGVPNTTPSAVIVTVAPPALPVYMQPDPPAPDYIWTPGYWAYNSFWEDYYWVPGTWVTAPSPGLLWTPGYWGWNGGHFIFNDGYWGIHIGFYGGVHYGHGYDGNGFSGGEWRNHVFVNKTVNVTNNTTNNNSSFNGGPGGTHTTPTPTQRNFMKERHFPPTAQQRVNVQAAVKNPALRASRNHGKPSIAATAKPGVFKGKGVVAAKRAGTFYNKTTQGKNNQHHPSAVHHPATQHKNIPPKHVVKKPVVKKKPKPQVPPANGNNT